MLKLSNAPKFFNMLFAPNHYLTFTIMRTLFFWLTTLMIASGYCHADSVDNLDAQMRKAESLIPALIKQYGTSLGCAFNMNPKNIVPFEFKGEKSFIALFSLDVGCSGGSAMSRPVFAVVQLGAFYSFKINADYSNPKQTSDNFPQIVTDLFLDNGELRYKALKLDFTKDALCCPSIAIEGKLTFENGVWKSITIK